MPADHIFYDRSPMFKIAFNNLCDDLMEEYEGRHTDVKQQSDSYSETNETRDFQEVNSDEIERLLRGES